MVLCVSVSALLGYLCKQGTYVDIVESKFPFHLHQDSIYYIYPIDSSAITIKVSAMAGGSIQIKLDCNNSFAIQNYPIEVQAVSKARKMLFSKQYKLNYKKSRIILDATAFSHDESILQIGYFNRDEVASGNYFFHCASFEVGKCMDGSRKISRYTGLDQQEKDGKFIINSVIKERFHYVYVYKYDIDFDFKGFKDSGNKLISAENVKIELNNGSVYVGAVKDGYFEGYGRFSDVILRRVLEGNFTHGVIQKDTVVSKHEFVRVIDWPMLSKSYPVNGCYRTEYLFIDSLNRKRTDFKYSESRSRGIILYQEVYSFDVRGNMTTREWKGFDAYYLKDGPFALGLSKNGKSIGVAKVVYGFDGNGNVVDEKFFDSKGNLLRNGSIGRKPVLFSPLRLK